MPDIPEGLGHQNAIETVTSCRKCSKKLQWRLQRRLWLYYDGVDNNTIIVPMVCSSQGWTIMEKQIPLEDNSVEVWQENNVKIGLGEGR